MTIHFHVGTWGRVLIRVLGDLHTQNATGILRTVTFTLVIIWHHLGRLDYESCLVCLGGTPKLSTLLTVILVGGNAVSAFLSWRLQATNACDVTLVWKSGFAAVSQYGISFKWVQVSYNPASS